MWQAGNELGGWRVLLNVFLFGMALVLLRDMGWNVGVVIESTVLAGGHGWVGGYLSNGAFGCPAGYH